LHKFFARNGYKVYGLVRSKEKAQQSFLALHEIIPVIGDFDSVELLTKYIGESGIIIESASMTPSSTFIDTVADLAVKSGKTTDTGEEKLVIWTTGMAQRPFEDKFLATKGIVPAVVRPCFIYGGNGGPNFQRLFFRKPEAKIKIYGLPKKRFPWIHCNDLAEGYLLLAKNKSQIGGKRFQIGNYEDVPFHDDLIIACARVQGWNGKAERTGQNGTWVGDVEYIAEALDGTYDKMIDWDIKEFENSAITNLGWKPSHRNSEFIKNLDVYFHAYQVWNPAS